MEITNFDERFFRTLITQLLAQSPDALENERLEVKGWCRDECDLIDKVVDAGCCLANAEGGYVLVGVDEKEHRRFSGCPHPNISPNYLALRIQDHTHPPVACRGVDLTALLSEVRGIGGAQLYALEIDRKRCISGHTNSKGVSKIRVGKECRVQYTADDDRTSALVPDVTTDDLSLDSIRWAMAYHKRSFSLFDPGAHAWEFLAQARLLQNPNDPSAPYDQYRVTLAALILFGKQAALARILPYCQTVLQTPAGNQDLRKNVVESLARAAFD